MIGRSCIIEGGKGVEFLLRNGIGVSLGGAWGEGKEGAEG